MLDIIKDQTFYFKESKRYKQEERKKTCVCVFVHVVSVYEDASPSDAQGDKPLTGCSAQRKELWQHVSNAGYHVFLLSLMVWLYI